MFRITFIGTIHNEIGKCNADELCKILKSIKPDVVFLEAIESTYSKYHRMIFNNFGVFHKKLEIKTLQKYDIIADFEYVPVLDHGIDTSFDERTKLICQDGRYRDLIDNFNLLAKEQGFEFINSVEGIKRHEQMRKLGDEIVNDDKINENFYRKFDQYENSMLENIFSYSLDHRFENAVFLCGNGHIHSIKNKLKSLKKKEKTFLNWSFYGDEKLHY